ncbi:hypothetical protein Dda_2417 [Drechslerella dactyloides]|uniref:Phospholipase C/D domain-containing protein n=1 Tax=Drechslerella dactyloides TaxID=74499 RepID=A0AAD6NN03_DREDA|nr:hypothetical protein Dda_2417 [Drechslerella dactyloides]
MPGPFTHIYTARRAADFLQSENINRNFVRGSDGSLGASQALDRTLVAELGPARCGAIMDKWPKFTSVGAIGPDLFFWMQDYNIKGVPCDELMLAMSLLYYLEDQKKLDDPYDGLLTILAEVSGTWSNILRFLIKLHRLWEKFKDIYDATIGPIIEKANQIVDDLTGGLYSALGDAVSQFLNAIMTLVQEELFTTADIFNWFSLKMRAGVDEQAFLWSDMTHYRRTSVLPAKMISYARAMMRGEEKQAQEHGEQLMAFGLGWVCHVGADVIAHSFVNEQCGGPFRTHWQRHHLIENHIDAFNYECTNPANGGLLPDDFIGWQDTYPSVADAALYFATQIPQNIDGLSDAQKQGDLRRPLPQGDDFASKQSRKKLLETNGELPQWLAEALAQALIEVYAEPKEGGDKELQSRLGEGNVPHPQNLKGQAFQNDLKADTGIIAKWLRILGVDNTDIALDDLRKAIAPDFDMQVPPGFPFPWEIKVTYRFMMSWFKKTYVSTLDFDRPDPPEIFTPVGEDYDTGPPDFSGVGEADDPVSKACAAVAALLDWIFKVLGAVAKFLYDVVKTIASAATFPAREAIYYGVTLPLWEATQNMRNVLAHLGYTIPQSEKFANGHLKRPNEIDHSLIRLGHTVDSAFKTALAAAADPLGNLDKDPSLIDVGIRDVLGAPNPWLPVRVNVDRYATRPKLSSLGVVEYQRPWAFPDRNNCNNINRAANYLETPQTIAGPYPTGMLPNEFLATNKIASNTARVLFENAGCPHDTDVYAKAFVTHTYSGDKDFGQGKFEGTNPLGDPIVFSSYLIGQIANNPRFLSNFNLDADRGYGYLCWDWQRGPKPKDQSAPTDGRGNEFFPPLTWPEGSEEFKWPWPPVEAYDVNQPRAHPKPLELWYPGKKCKEPEDDGDDDGGIS